MPNAATNSPDGYTSTITTAATPHSAANHPPPAYLTSQVSTTSPWSVVVGVGVGTVDTTTSRPVRRWAQDRAQPPVEVSWVGGPVTPNSVAVLRCPSRRG